MLRTCILEWKGDWERQLSLVEFAYNNSFHASIGMISYEVLYGRPCKSPLCWKEVGDQQLIGPEVVQEISEKI